MFILNSFQNGRISFLIGISLISSAALYADEESASTQNNKQQAMLVLDASGSMWGKVDDRHKIEIARDVIEKTVSSWNSEVELGLMAYGHNRKGDCKDIEVLVKPGPLNASSFTKKATDLNPKGKTPLTAAVKQAADTLKYTEEKATVILISDGEETCDLDPCEVGRKLEETGVDFTAHIISFAVPQEQTQGMRCLAETTGGSYIEANSADELQQAMDDAREVVTTTEAPKLEKATLNVPAEVPAGSEFLVEWTGPQNRNDYLIIRSPDAKHQYKSSYIGNERYQSPSKITAPEKPGEYLVRYEVNKDTSLGEAAITVIPVSATVDAPDSVIAGSEFEIEWSGPRNLLDHIRIFSPDGKKKFASAYVYQESQSSPSTIRAPEEPGQYVARYMTNGGNKLGADSFEVTAPEVSVNAPDSVEAGSPFEVEWSGPKNTLDYVGIFSPDGKKKYSYTYIYQEKEISPSEIKAPEDAGQYLIRYMTDSGKLLAEDRFEVTAAEASVSAKKSVAAGSAVSVDWTGPQNTLDYLGIFKPDGKKRITYKYIYHDKVKSPSEVKAPEDAGDYLLRYMTEAGKVLAETELTVTPVSATLSAADTVPAGAKFMIEWTGPRNEFDNLRVYSANGKKKFDMQYVFRENQVSPTELKAPEKPGAYEVRYMTQAENILGKHPFEVTPVSATIEKPAAVTAGEKFKVNWSGPRNEFDHIRIFSANGKKKFDMQYVFRENQVSPTELKAPEEPGSYLIRYVTPGDNVLGETELDVQ